MPSANEIRQQLQDKALNALVQNHYVQVNWATGTGKSRVAIKAFRILRQSGRTRALLLVAETLHKENWRREFVDALGEQEGNKLFNSITVECYASLDKYEGTAWDIIVADEAHHLRSEQRCDLIGSMSADYFLGLSATLSCNGDADELMRILEMTYGRFTSLDFNIQDAIDNGVLAEPHIYVHVLPLADLQKPVEIVEEWGLEAKRVDLRTSYAECDTYFDRTLYPNARLVIVCTPQEAYDYYTERMAQWKSKTAAARRSAGIKDESEDTPRIRFMWNKYRHYCSERKMLLGRVKTTFSKRLLASLAGKKYICFCSDVAQGNELGGDHVIYSDREDGVKNADVIAAFNDDRISSLFAVNMIQEGQNLAGIQAGVIIQLGGKERQFIQKFGRAMRSRTPEQHIIVLNGTRDIDYFKTAIAGINRKYITYETYGSLRQGPSS